MRILLIHPPDNRNSIAPGRFEPLALEVLAATVPDDDVRIIDLRIDDIREMERQLDSFHPVITGLTVNNTIHVREAVGILYKIRSRHPDIKLIVGGHHPTVMPGDFHLGCVDYIFLGWAEKSFPEFIKCIGDNSPIDHIEGLEVLDRGQVVSRKENPWDLKPSEIPSPRRELVNKYRSRYRSDMGFRTALVNTTRGCGNRCTFCSVWRSAGGHFLVRRPEDIFNEIASLPDNINIDPSFDFNDFNRIAAYVRILRLNSPIFPILTPIPGSLYYEEAKDRISLSYDYFDYAHAVLPTRLSPGLFYKAWIRLFQESYPIWKNLLFFFRKHLARLIGNKRMEKENYNYNLLNLFILKVLSVFLAVKLKKHVRALESGML